MVSGLYSCFNIQLFLNHNIDSPEFTNFQKKVSCLHFGMQSSQRQFIMIHVNNKSQGCLWKVVEEGHTCNMLSFKSTTLLKIRCYSNTFWGAPANV